MVDHLVLFECFKLIEPDKEVPDLRNELPDLVDSRGITRQISPMEHVDAINVKIHLHWQRIRIVVDEADAIFRRLLEVEALHRRRPVRGFEPIARSIASIYNRSEER